MRKDAPLWVPVEKWLSRAPTWAITGSPLLGAKVPGLSPQPPTLPSFGFRPSGGGACPVLEHRDLGKGQGVYIVQLIVLA